VLRVSLKTEQVVIQLYLRKILLHEQNFGGFVFLIHLGCRDVWKKCPTLKNQYFNQSKLTSYAKFYEVKRILLLETGIKTKMLTIVLPTEKRTCTFISNVFLNMQPERI